MAQAPSLGGAPEERSMTFYRKRSPLKYLGSLRGSGGLRIGDAEGSVGQVGYEIDCYCDGARHYASGQIDGSARHLTAPFEAGGAQIALPGGLAIDVVVGDPTGENGSDVTVRGKPVLFN
jgi:hypothetical protein